MTEERIKELQEKLATAMGLLTEVQKATYGELGYRQTRKEAHRAIRDITHLSEALDWEWEQDERELDEDLEGT